MDAQRAQNICLKGLPTTVHSSWLEPCTIRVIVHSTVQYVLFMSRKQYFVYCVSLQAFCVLDMLNSSLQTLTLVDFFIVSWPRRVFLYSHFSTILSFRTMFSFQSIQPRRICLHLFLFDINRIELFKSCRKTAKRDMFDSLKRFKN